MKALGRLTLLVVTVVVMSLLFGVTSQAKGGGPGPGPTNLPAGTYHFTTQRASFNFFGAFPAPMININVSDSKQVSTPRGGPTTVTAETDVFVQVNSQTVNFGGCFVLANTADFSFSNLQTASLHTAISSSTPGCGGFSNFVPAPFVLDVTWTGTGPIATSRGDANFKCATYRSQSTTHDSSNLANATASLVPLFSDSFTVTGHAGLGSNDQRIHAKGISLDSCPPAIGGKGSGPGLQPAGSYHFTSLQAGSNFSDSSGSQVGIFVSEGTQTSRPEDGPTTTTNQTNVIVQIFAGATFGIACYAVAPADFTFSGVQTAALHTKITSSTPLCQGPAFGVVPLPLNLDVTWTGTGPIATLRSDGQYRCLDYNSESEIVILTNTASVTGTVTPLFTGPLTGTFGSLVNANLHIDAEGVVQQACIVRG